MHRPPVAAQVESSLQETRTGGPASPLSAASLAFASPSAASPIASEDDASNDALASNADVEASAETHVAVPPRSQQLFPGEQP
jgi:hypothetical protein